MDSPPQAPPSAAEYLRLVGIAALIGIPAALAAALFLGLIHGLEDWLWDELPASLGYAAPPWFLVLGLPVVGALLVVLARAFLPGDGGHRPLEGLSMAPTPPSFVPGVVLAAVGTLAFGAVLGPEMPVIALGSAVGVVAHRARASWRAGRRRPLQRGRVLGDLGTVRRPARRRHAARRERSERRDPA